MDIDYQNEVLYGVLQRMAPSVGEMQPVLQSYWMCEINPRDSGKLLALIKERFQYTSESLKHLKRMKKVQKASGEVVLQVLVCPAGDQEYPVTQSELVDLIKDRLDHPATRLQVQQIPLNKPLDKDVNQLWSEKYWPLLWKGNPKVQELNEIYKNIDIAKVRKYIKEIAGLSHATTSTLPVVTMFVDPSTDEVKALCSDRRTPNNPLKHPIMECISTIAEQELAARQKRKSSDVRENNYLCLNYHVYTTHEPCTMCAMALVHSRISQLVYIKPSKKTGGIGKESGHGEMIHLSCSLNWKFEAFMYLDSDVASQVEAVDESCFI